MDDGVPYNGASTPTEAAELLVDAPSEQVQQELYAVDAPLAEMTDESDRLCQAFDGVPDGSLTGDMDSLVAESLQSVSDVADSISIELGRSVEPSIAGKSVGDADSDGDAEAAMSERSPLLESQEMTDRLRQLLLRLFPSHIVPAQTTAPSAVVTTADKKVGSRKRSRIEGVGFTASLHEDRRHAVEFLHNVCEDKAFFHGAWRRYREASTHRAPCHPRRRIKTVFSPVVRRTRGDRGSSPPPSSCSCPVERFTFAPWVVMPASTASPSGEEKTAVAQGPNTTSDGHTMAREVEPTSHTPASTRPVQARGPSVGAPVLSVDELRMFARHVMSSGRLRHECGEPYQFLMARLRELRQEPPLHP